MTHSDTDTWLWPCSRPGLSPRLGSDLNTGPGWTCSVLLFSCLNIQWRNVNKLSQLGLHAASCWWTFHVFVSADVSISAQMYWSSHSRYINIKQIVLMMSLWHHQRPWNIHLSDPPVEDTRHVHPSVYQMSINNSITSSSDGQRIDLRLINQSINQSMIDNENNH